MESRILPGPREARQMGTTALRDAFLVADLFADAQLRIVSTDMDRLVLGGAAPTGEPLTLPRVREFGTGYFTERREIGIVNLAGAGHVRVGRQLHSLGTYDFLYIGAGNPEISFEACNGGQPCFYFLSCPAHFSLPVVRKRWQDVDAEPLGESAHASARRIRRYIHSDGVRSCQLVMGFTELEAGSVWNTMPPHTHSRRSEVYLYVGPEEGLVVHLMGEPRETRHLLVRNREAVLSPSWSIHSGAGTGSYSFVWGMAGENQAFADMDTVELHQLR